MTKDHCPTLPELMLRFRRKFLEKAKKTILVDELTFPQMEVLQFIGPTGSKNMESIAKHLHIAPPSATALVEKMEKKQLVVRKKDSTDRRVVCIELTPKTKKQIQHFWKQKEEMIEQLLSKLSDTDRKHFERIMKILIEE